MTNQHSFFSPDRLDRDLYASSQTGERVLIRGKAKVRSLLFNCLFPLHVMAEVGGLSMTWSSMRRSLVQGFDDPHSDRLITSAVTQKGKLCLETIY